MHAARTFHTYQPLPNNHLSFLLLDYLVSALAKRKGFTNLRPFLILSAASRAGQFPAQEHPQQPGKVHPALKLGARRASTDFRCIVISPYLAVWTAQGQCHVLIKSTLCCTDNVFYYNPWKLYDVLLMQTLCR